MFLCSKCHGDCGCTAGMGLRSFGRCEGCRASASCVDCKAHHARRTTPVVPLSNIPAALAAIDAFLATVCEYDSVDARDVAAQSTLAEVARLLQGDQ